MRTCTHCGKDNEDAAGCCAGCGESLNGSSQVFSPVSDEKKLRRVALAWAGLVIGGIGTGSVALMHLPFFFVPRGAGIRPMALATVWLLLAAGTFVAGLPCALLGTTSNKRSIGWLGVVLSIAPGPLGFAMLLAAMALRGFHLKP